MQLDDLRALFIFDGVSDDQLRLLLAAGEEVPFHAGMELFREGRARRLVVGARRLVGRSRPPGRP